MSYVTEVLWGVDLGWLPDTHPATVSAQFLNRMGGKNKMKKFVRQDNNGEITYQVLPRPKETRCGEN